MKMIFSGQDAICNISDITGGYLTIGGMAAHNSTNSSAVGGCLAETVGNGAYYIGIPMLIIGIIVLTSGKNYESAELDISIRKNKPLLIENQ